MTIHWSDPLVQIKATTIYRLCVRKGRLWADDAWAFFSMLSLCVQIAAVFMHVPNPSELSRLHRVAAYYLMAATFYATIWSARLSILFSIIRLDPSESRRKRLLYIAFVYILVCLILIAQLFWVCEPEHGWKDMESPQCTLNKEVAICQLVYLILIIAPLKLLKGLEDKGLRHRLMVIFSTCIVTTIVSLVHAVYILKLGGTKVVIAALVEDCVSLIVCNIPVVVTASIRLRERTQARRSTRFSTFITFATGRSRTRKDTFATTGVTVDDPTYSDPDLPPRRTAPQHSARIPHGDTYCRVVIWGGLGG
ncbi:hypothetical protein BD779DRAFT_1470436 [Infundibulicybe gibba]|nr:hypothetical protein BD779DRAFT_1470436 [Infundibulicybe gibba]